MVKVIVRTAMAEGCDTLCRTCTKGHIITGFRATEEEVFCRTFYIEREIRFPVRECTFYEDKRIATKDDMVEIARHLRTPSKLCRDMGFAGTATSEPTSPEVSAERPIEE